MASCSAESILESLLEDRPPNPGSERKKGEVLTYDRTRDGEWYTERNYSTKQKEQKRVYDEWKRDHGD